MASCAANDATLTFIASSNAYSCFCFQNIDLMSTSKTCCNTQTSRNEKAAYLCNLFCFRSHATGAGLRFFISSRGPTIRNTYLSYITNKNDLFQSFTCFIVLCQHISVLSTMLPGFIEVSCTSSNIEIRF